MFSLDPRLESDTVSVLKLKLCRVQLMRDKTVPWIVLVPERSGISEIHELSKEDRIELVEEITLASRAMEKAYGPDKINVGALGNIVKQLHVHVVGRFENDRAWPGPVWGAPGAEPYSDAELKDALAKVSGAFASILE